MFYKVTCLTILLLCMLCCVSTEVETELKHLVTRAEVQSCRGCSLNRLPQVKSFIFEDLPQYCIYSSTLNSGIDFKVIPGAIPDFVLFNKADKELKRIDLSRLNRQECNELLEKWGFRRTQNLKEL